MTMELPDGRRVLVYRDGAPVIEDDGRDRPIVLADLDPASRRIVEALIAAADSAHHAHGGEGRRETCVTCVERQQGLRRNEP